jgi:hypothetical protein
MKKMGILFAIGICCIMVGCGQKNDSSNYTTSVSSMTDSVSEVSENNVVSDLSGTWKQDGDLGEMYQVASINDDTIWIYWYNTVDASYTLYWAGSLEQPENSKAYTWTSENDHEKTDVSILASGDNTKDFTYKNGKISYECSISGTTKIVNLIQSDIDLPVSLLATSKKEEQLEVEKIKSNLEVTCEIANKRVLYVFVTNNSEYKADNILLKLTLKDAEGNKVDYQEESLEQVLGKTTVVRKFITETDYDDYEIDEEVNDNNISIYSGNFATDISVESNRSGSNIIVDCTNNAECNIDDLNCVVVVYKDGKIADSEEYYYLITDDAGVFDLKEGETQTIKYEIPEDVSFDDYKVFINGAYVY